MTNEQRVDQSHPDYFEGFYGAMEDEPLFPDASPHYRHGWNGGWVFRNLFSFLVPDPHATAVSAVATPKAKEEDA